MTQKVLSLIATVAAIFFSNGISAQENSFAPLFPFQPTHNAPDNITNVRTWAGVDNRTAGSDGFITSEGNRFVDGYGRERRFIGTNIGMTGCFPDHESADKLAKELTRYGINIVRMHYVSHRTPKEGYPVKDSFIEPVQLERFDYFFAKLKENGIYVYFQLNIARKITDVNGFENTGKLPKYKNGVDNVNYRMIELQKRFHKEILNHVNPYTGICYKDDPAISMFELANENSIVNVWFKPSYKFTALVEPYKTQIKEMWNVWLNSKYEDTEAVKKAWKEGVTDYSWPEWQTLEKGNIDWPLKSNWKQLPRRAIDYTEFLADLESNYFSDLYCNTKVDLGVKQPVTGTQLEYGFNQPQSEMDYCDIHGYWCHPGFNGPWDWNHFWVRNESILTSYGNPASTLTKIARARILGKPYTISEYDHPNLNFYCAEGDIMLSALGAFQNWSGLMQFAWILNTDYDRTYLNRMFDMCSAPQKLVHFPACYAMFVRGDVRKGDESVVFAYPSEAHQDIAAVAKGETADSHGKHTSKLLNSLPLAFVSGRQVMEKPELFPETGKHIIRSEEDVPESIKEAFSNKLMKSSTGELIWNWQEEGAETFMVDTRNTKVFSGFIHGRTFTFRGMTLTPGKTRLDWMTLSLTLANPYGNPKPSNILRPGTYLLAATGYVQNTGEKIIQVDNPHRMSNSLADGANPGTAPILCEGIDADISLMALGGRVKCFALDPDGNRMQEVPVKTGDSGEALLHIGHEFKTVWYELTIAEK